MHTIAGRGGRAGARFFNPRTPATLGLILATLGFQPETCRGATTPFPKTAHPPAEQKHHPLKAAFCLIKGAGHLLQVARPLATRFASNYLRLYALHP